MVTRFSDTCKKEISIRGEGGDRVLRTKISLSSRVPFILLVVLSAGTGSNCLFSIFSIPSRQKMKLLYYCRTEIAHLCNFFFLKPKRTCRLLHLMKIILRTFFQIPFCAKTANISFLASQLYWELCA